MPSKAARFQAAPLEPLAATARAEVVAAELLLQQLVAMDEANADLHVRFRGIASPTLAHWLEKRVLLGFGGTWDTSFEFGVGHVQSAQGSRTARV